MLLPAAYVMDTRGGQEGRYGNASLDITARDTHTDYNGSLSYTRKIGDLVAGYRGPRTKQYTEVCRCLSVCTPVSMFTLLAPSGCWVARHANGQLQLACSAFPQQVDRSISSCLWNLATIRLILAVFTGLPTAVILVDISLPERLLSLLLSPDYIQSTNHSGWTFPCISLPGHPPSKLLSLLIFNPGSPHQFPASFGKFN